MWLLAGVTAVETEEGDKRVNIEGADFNEVLNVFAVDEAEDEPLVIVGAR